MTSFFFPTCLWVVYILFLAMSPICKPDSFAPFPISPSILVLICILHPSLHPSVSFFFPLANLLLRHADFSVLGPTGVSFSRQPMTPAPPLHQALDPTAHPDPVCLSWLLLSISLLIPLPLNILLLCVPWHVLS